MATVIKTIGTGGGRDYSTVTLWENDLANTATYSNGDDAIGECYNDSFFNERVSFAQSTIAFNTVTLRPASGERHDGTIGTGVEFDWDSIAGHLLADLNTTGYATIEGIVFDGEYSSSTLDMSYLTRITAGDWKLLGCIINKKRWGKSSLSPVGINDNGGNNTVIANNIVQNCGRYTGSTLSYVAGYAIHNDNSSAHNAEYYNNTMFAGYGGFRANSSTNNYVKNNIVADMASSDYTWGNAVHDYNISNDSTATGTNSITGVSTSSLFVSTVYGSEDLHILSTSSAVGAGVDLGSTPDGIQYDIDNYDRTAASNWSIGADQYVSPVTALNSNVGLFTTGPPASNATIFVRGANILNDVTQTSIPLTLAKQPEGFAALSVGYNPDTVDNFGLYIDGHQGFGGVDDNQALTLFMSSPQNNGVPFNTTNDLVINGPNSQSYPSGINLFIKSEKNPPSVKALRLLASGAAPTSSYPLKDQDGISLFVRHEVEYNTNVDLHIESDVDRGDNITLFIKSDHSGVMPLYTSGVYKQNSSIDLLIKAPQSSAMNLFNRGYRE